VQLEARMDGPHAVVFVEDSGPGIPRAERELVFERFRRGADTGGGGGFGLGLAIGRELAEKMDGELSLEPSDGGARFAFRLPVAAMPELILEPASA
jgi:signal transduction histidine kinase